VISQACPLFVPIVEESGSGTMQPDSLRRVFVGYEKKGLTQLYSLHTLSAFKSVADRNDAGGSRKLIPVNMPPLPQSDFWENVRNLVRNVTIYDKPEVDFYVTDVLQLFIYCTEFLGFSVDKPNRVLIGTY